MALKISIIFTCIFILCELVLISLPFGLRIASQEMLHPLMGVFIISFLLFLILSPTILISACLKIFDVIETKGNPLGFDTVLIGASILLWLPAFSTTAYFQV